MFNYIAYFKYIIKHKWYIFKAAKQTKASLLRVLLHDLSKFLPSEWFAYMNTYYNKDGSKKKFKHNRAFDVAWTKQLDFSLSNLSMRVFFSKRNCKFLSL